LAVAALESQALLLGAEVVGSLVSSCSKTGQDV